MRIKFYSVNDLSSGHNLNKVEKVLKEYHESNREIQNINDIIELYNINKFFEKKMYLTNWTSDEIYLYEKTAKSYLKEIAIFLKKITDYTFESSYVEVDRHYREDFWELIDKFEVYENISPDIFKEFMNNLDIRLYQLLKYRRVVGHFSYIIRDYMVNNYITAELLLDKYEMKNNHKSEDLYLPKELSSSDKEAIINNYIDSENPNLNYLRLISNVQSNKDKLEISPKTLLKAKKKTEEQEKNFFQGNSGVSIGMEVRFSKSQDEEIIIKEIGLSTNIIYGTRWIEDNIDYPTLLNNFIYLFQFADD